MLYFNNSATSWPKPKSVLDKVNMTFSSPYQESGRGNDESKDFAYMTRKLLGEFFNANQPDHFIFTANATDALNILIHGFAKKQTRKFNVISTTLEHNSVLRPLNTLVNEKKIKLTLLEPDEHGHLKFDPVKFNNDIKLVVINHASNVLGTIQDIKSLRNQLPNAFFIIDASQSAGHTMIDITDMKIDALVFTGHKALYGLPGIGGFYIKDPTIIAPTRQGGTGVLSQYPLQPESMPLKFESGTLNYPGIISLYEGIRFVIKNFDKIRKKNIRMTGQIYDKLQNIKMVKLFCRPELPIISFKIIGLEDDDVGHILLNNFGIICRTGLHCAPLAIKQGSIRVSPSYFNTYSECNKLTSAIKKISDQVKNL